MSYVVEISMQAEADLRGIFAYIAFDLQSVQNAAAQLSRQTTSACSAFLTQKRTQYLLFA